MKEEKPQTTLPENATRELKPGEEYRPLLQPEKNYPEVTPWSVSIGLVMTIIFSAAAAYLGLKVGQVFEAAIPIAIIAVGLSSALGRKNSLGENVIIQSILQSGFSRIMAEKLLHLQNADPERVMELEKVSDSRGRHPLVQIPEKED